MVCSLCICGPYSSYYSPVEKLPAYATPEKWEWASLQNMTLMLICTLLWKNIHKDSITTFIRLQHTPSWIGIMNYNRLKAVDWAHLAKSHWHWPNMLALGRSSAQTLQRMLLVDSLLFSVTVTSVSSWHMPLAQMVKAGAHNIFMIGVWEDCLKGATQCSMHLLCGASDPLHPHFFPDYIRRMSCVVIKLHS